MGFSFAKFNKGAVKFNYQLPDGAEFKKISDLRDGFTGVVKAVGVSQKGHYGDSPFIISDGFGVWLPKHMADTVKEILDDPEAVTAINEGKACFNVYAYEYEDKATKQPTTGYSVNFVDAEPVQ